MSGDLRQGHKKGLRRGGSARGGRNETVAHFFFKFMVLKVHGDLNTVKYVLYH